MKKKLGDVFEIGSGGTPSKTHPEYYGGDIPWVKTGDLKSEYLYEVEDFITEEGLNNSSAKMYESDTVLIAMYGATIGATSILNFPACTNQACAAFKKSEEILPEYLYFFLRSKKEKFVNDGVGGTQPNISAGYLKKVQIEVRSLDEQSEIINVLDKVNRIIDERTKELATLDDLIKARFVELFGNESNPKAWEIVNVESVADVQVGVVIKPSQYYTDAIDGIKAFRSLNVGEGFIKDENWVYFTKEGHKKNAKSVLKENDLLIVRSGAPGTACVVTKEYEGCNAIDIIIAHPNCEKVNPYYLCAYTNMPHGKKQINEGTGGAAQQHFNVTKYNKLQLMLPPMKLQDEFVTFVNQVNKSKLVIKNLLQIYKHQIQM